MPLKDCSNLLFYSECLDCEPAPFFSDQFFVGLYKDDALPTVLRCENAQWIKWTRWYVGRSLKAPATKFVAAALVSEIKGGKILVVKNVGADKGYGPLLYASLLHLARARGLNGVAPCLDPAKILTKPKLIWKQFASHPAYAETVSLEQFPGRHSEPWLNNIFSIIPGEELIAFEAMRSNTTLFWRFWESRGDTTSERGLMNKARSMAERSVDAHRTES